MAKSQRAKYADIALFAPIPIDAIRESAKRQVGCEIGEDGDERCGPMDPALRVEAPPWLLEAVLSATQDE